MDTEKTVMPDYLFEVSWEVCNKIGGIHTVLTTKSLNLSKDMGGNHIFIGPDVWVGNVQSPEFEEDPILLRTWRIAAAEEGLRLRIGRWKIEGGPIAILLDFSQFISQKDRIFTELWETFKLDSITGQWGDFIEEALFGYASGKVIESFVRFNLQPHHKVIAHFHEWMSGAGILYLKSRKVHVATVFTTHATVLGRCMACNGVPLYRELEYVNPDEKAKYFNVVAKHSLEKHAAANADVFTTVSDITARECEKLLGVKVDAVTPNGIGGNLSCPESERKQTAARARKKLTAVASSMCGMRCDDAFIIGMGGRYEYKSKGIDLFLDALGKLKNSGYSGRLIVAFMAIPAEHGGPDPGLSGRLAGNGSAYETNVSHRLSHPDTDPILSKLRSLNIGNAHEDKVKVFFIPTYLNGNDGIFNEKYCDLLSGMDMTIFPSYYEPWGYTPLESLALGVPTVTTTLAGFGLWVRDHFKGAHPSVSVIERNDDNYGAAVGEVAEKIAGMAGIPEELREEYGRNAVEVSKAALWDNNIICYRRAYASAIEKAVSELGAFPEYKDLPARSYRRIDVNKPTWNRVIVMRTIPERLKYLEIISKNLWWCWNEEAIDLFESINPDLWRSCDKNPIALLDKLTYGDYKKLEKNKDFLSRLDSTADIFNGYMAGKAERKAPSIAYFSMEYGLDTSLKIYSGGLGILAGDYLKESSDMKVRMTGIGLLYKYGYFTQRISLQGDQVADYEPQNFYRIPAMPVRDENGNWMTVSLSFPGRIVHAKIWRVDVGRTELYLLDTDHKDNLPEDRRITHRLYGGDWENRLKQELLLGIGGIRTLRALGIKCDLYHCNEGHAAFIGIERLREYIADDGFTFGEALELVRCSSLFTTHTPVPAGHDAFDEGLLRTYLNHYPQRMKIDWTTLMSLGKINPDDPGEKFSMSNLACSISQEVNGVSRMHGEVTRNILGRLWPGYLPEELHIGYVTNGVHYSTWTAPEWKEIHSKVFGEEFLTHNYDKRCFDGIYKVEDAEIWKVRSKLRSKLIKEVAKRISDINVSNHYSPQEVVKILDTLSDGVLTIGFARRFAAYKRAHLLFKDLDRLDAIVNNPDFPVQFLFAGKAHPADIEGQAIIKKMIEISKMPRFIGKIVFVPNYDMNLAKYLVQGVDVWMNTPTRPLEASGTSGEKAAMNGVMHFSVLDGWWVEGYKKDAGWALPMERTYDDQNFQNELDAATIYNIIENEIVPSFYKRDRKTGVPVRWIKYIKNTIAEVASDFTTNRMMNDYLKKFYMPLYERTLLLTKNDCAAAKEIAFWKKNIRQSWSHIEVKNYTRLSDSKGQPMLGQERTICMELFIGDINPDDIGVELVWTEQDKRGQYNFAGCRTFELESAFEGTAKYVCHFILNTTGAFYETVRVFAKNDLLPHRQDMDLVRWL